MRAGITAIVFIVRFASLVVGYAPAVQSLCCGCGNLPAYHVVCRGIYQGRLQGRYPTTSGVTPREPKADLADLADFSRGADEKRKELCY